MMIHSGHFSRNFRDRPVKVPPKNRRFDREMNIVPSIITCSSSRYYHINFAIARFENFLCCCIVVSNWIVWISILIENMRIRYFHFQTMCNTNVGFRRIERSTVRCTNDFSTQSTKNIDLTIETTIPADFMV